MWSPVVRTDPPGYRVQCLLVKRTRSWLIHYRKLLVSLEKTKKTMWR